MDRGLLVLGHVIAELRILLERLAEPGNAPVAEDAEASRKEGMTLVVAFNLLMNQELHNSLRHGQSFGLHRQFLESSSFLDKLQSFIFIRHEVGAAVAGDDNRARRHFPCARLCSNPSL